MFYKAYKAPVPKKRLMMKNQPSNALEMKAS